MLEPGLRQRANLPIVRLLAESWQGFEALSARHVRRLGLTPAHLAHLAPAAGRKGRSGQARS